MLNKRIECKIRDDGNGMDLIRNQPTMDSKGRVIVRSLTTQSVKDKSQIEQVIQTALSNRRTGSSNVHDQSSRSHAILLCEIVTEELVNTRERIFSCEGDIVPIGAKFEGIQIDLHDKGVFKDQYIIQKDGSVIPNPNWIGIDPHVKQEMDRLEAELLRIKNMTDELHLKEKELCTSIKNGKIIFTDLAGSEYGSDTKSNNKKQSDTEFKEAKEINMSLLALKECIRLLQKNSKHVPWRNSLFTRIIKSYLLKNNVKSKITMLANIGPLDKDEEKTNNTLK